VSNPPKQKGTGAETELKDKIDMLGLVRTPPGTKWDLEFRGNPDMEPLELLATRPDRGEWLITLRLEDSLYILGFGPPYTPLHIEVKRYKRFAHHKIFEDKFGKV